VKSNNGQLFQFCVSDFVTPSFLHQQNGTGFEAPKANGSCNRL
jgi:hypothetical protein